MNRFNHYLILTTSIYLSAYATAEPDISLSIAGSNTIGAKLAPQCAQQFLRSKNLKNISITTTAKDEYKITGIQDINGIKKNVNIAISAHGSSTGFAALAERNAAIAMASRPIKPEEIERLSFLGDMKSPSAEHALAVDGIAILVNPSNTVQSLTIDQVASIFSGRINNWKQLNGANMPIHIYARDENSGTWDTFKELVLGGNNTLSTEAKRFESSDDIADKVANDLGGIGFTGLSSIHNNKVLAIADDEKSTALKPSRFTIATEDYALSRRLYLYTSYSANISLADEFVDFCLSNEGQEIVTNTGFISQNIHAYKPIITDNMPDEYKQLASQAERLSLNFRFTDGSPLLDNKAYRDIKRLHDFLMSQKDTLAIVLVGFSDGNEQLTTNTLISRFRALSVKGALLEEGIVVDDIYALGSYLPLASNNKHYGKTKNGRVEVWVRRLPNKSTLANN